MNRCPFCGSGNVDCEVIELGDGPMAGEVQDGPMFCVDCGARQDLDGEWVKGN